MNLLSVLFLISCVSLTYASCPAPWKEYNDTCYFFSNNRYRLNDALYVCTSRNASIFVPDTQDERDFVVKYIERGQRILYWVGLRVINSTWTWLDDSPYDVNSTQWFRHQVGKTNDARSGCAAIYSYKPDTGHIQQRRCTDSWGVICEKPNNAVDVCNSADNWHLVEQQCYKLFDEKANFYDARKVCQQNGGDLYMPMNAREVYSIGDLNQCRTRDDAAWIGVSDTIRPGTFMLINNRTLRYQAWYSYGRQILKRGGTCVFANAIANYLWESELCVVEKKFICSRPQGTCPDGWIGSEDTCYQVNTAPTAQTTWFAAKTFCENQKTKLLTIDSDDEENFIRTSISNLQIQRMWLGFSDVNSSNQYQWINGTMVTYGYINWDTNFPKHHDSKVTNCGILQIGPGSSHWSNGYCFDFLPFICKSPLMKMVVSVKPPPVTRHCDPGWKLFRNHCYYFGHSDNSTGYSFTDAHHYCVARNAELTSISDAYEQSYITVNQAQIGTAWIGLQYSPITKQIVQIVDNMPIPFKSFYPGEPDDVTNGSTCIRIMAGRQDFTGSWDDGNCSSPLDFICKKQSYAGPPSMTTPPSTTVFGWSYKCGPDWKYNALDDFCYQVISDHPKTWPDAQWDCNRRGGNLSSISGPREQNFIQAILAAGMSNVPYNFWIGATDGNQEGGWEWIDGAPFAFFHWDQGEPNESGVGEDCVEMVSMWEYRWNDKRCDKPNAYICKKLAAPTTIPAGSPTETPPKVCVVEPMISGNYSLLDGNALTASTVRSPRNAAADSRYYKGSRGGWSSLNTNPGQYIKASFYNTVVMKAVTTVGRSDADEWVVTYKLQYQYDFYSEWEWYEEPPGTVKIFTGNSDPDTPVTNTIQFPIEARGIKLFPLSWHNGISLRWEILGCIQDFCTPDYSMSGPLVVPSTSITSSTSSDSNHAAPAGRLHPIRTNTAPSCWRAQSTTSSNEWFQVDLGKSRIIRGITTAGNPDAQEWVTQYKLLYNIHGPRYNFNYYSEPYGKVKTIPGNTNNNETATYFFKGHFTARFLRLEPLAFHSWISLQMDVLICAIGCSGVPLINGKNKLNNDRLAATSEIDPEHGPFRSRLNTPAKGRYGGAWTARYNDAHQYIQADLGDLIQVVSIATQGRQDQAEWVTSYNISYSQDGKVWYAYDAYTGHSVTFDGNWDQTSVRKHDLKYPIMARVVRLWPVAYHIRISLRWEIYGCPGADSGIQIGCYADDPLHRDLTYEPSTDPSVGMWPPMCIHHCFNKGYYYAGLQNQYQCFCGNSYGRYGPASDCILACFPQTSHHCGGPTSNLIYSTGLTPDYKVCLPQWTGYEDMCYFLMLDLQTWDEGQHQCKVMGGDLATVNSQAVQDLLFSIMNQKNSQDIWIGLTDSVEEALFEWSSGQPVKYTNWNLNQPRSPTDQDQDCVSMSNTTGAWQDEDCYSHKQYMCMSPKHGTNKPTTPQPVVGCVPGWTAYRWSCYLVVDMPRAFTNAARVCRDRSANVVRIEDRYEQAYLSSVLASKTGQYWTDVTDTASPGTYKYAKDGTALQYTNWGPNRPSGSSRCVAIQAGDGNNGLWFDVPCNTTAKVVCEQTRRGYTTPTRPPTTTGFIPCPMGWWTNTKDPNSCFQVNIQQPNRRLSYSDAEADCGAQGAVMAVFHNSAAYDTLWRNRMVGTNNGNFWFGLKYSHTGNGGRVFSWSDNSQVDFINWSPGEPNNFHNAENCVEALFYSGQWNDAPCGIRKNWICSIPRGTTPRPRTTLPTPPAPLDNCPVTGYYRYPVNNHCYFVQDGSGNNAKTWREARSVCQTNGGDLVSIGGILEQRFIDFMIANVSQNTLWIGFNEIDSPYGYHWSDGTVPSFINWHSNEPNDYGGAEDCGQIYVANGKWLDNHCAVKTGFVCENGLVSHNNTTPAPVIQGNCPVGFRPYGNKCFRVFTTLKTWQNASKYCQSLGGGRKGFNLASIANKYENAFVTTLLGNRGGITPWIGLQFVNGQIRWIDNSDQTYSNWDRGEPNGQIQSLMCTRIYGRAHNAGLWDDYPCTNTNPFICETKKSPSIATPEPLPNSCLIHPGFKPFMSDCFKYVPTKMDWTSANAFCQGFGGSVYLATISNKFEEDFLLLLINDPSITTKSGVWIGLQSPQGNGTYSWIDSKWPVLYTNWAQSQPATAAGKQQCVSSNLNGGWAVMPCSFHLPFVCKLSTANPPVTPPAPNAQCPDAGWIPEVNGTKCFLFMLMDTKSYLDATLTCSRQQATLVSISGIRENIKLITAVGAITNQVASFWTGLHKYSSSGYQWADNSPVSFMYWDKGEPSGQTGRGNHEDCVEMQTWNGKWNDLDCGLKRGYICQKNKVADHNIITIPGGAPNTSLASPTKALTPTPGNPGQSSSKVTNNQGHSTPHVINPNPTPKPSNPPVNTHPSRPGVTNPTQPRMTSVPTGYQPGVTQKQGSSGSSDSSSSGMGGGGIAGIVIGCLAVVAITGVGVVLWRRRQTSSPSGNGLGFDNSVYQYDSKEEHGGFTNSTSTDS